MTRSNSARLVFVVGVAHCGSTLLGRMLNMHRRVLCVGEMARIHRSLREGRPCGCGQALASCELWSRFLPEIESTGAVDFRRFSPRLYDRIAEIAEKDVIVDLSKTRVYRMTRWWLDRGQRYIFLVRDPRGVLASVVRAGKDLDNALRKHKKWTSRLQRFIGRKGERALRVYYEDLADRPEAELRRICDFIGIEFVPEMLRPAEKRHHFIASSVSDYLKGSNEIRLDERWRTELSHEQVNRIERMMSRQKLLRDRYAVIEGRL
jgi:hypothetical protein